MTLINPWPDTVQLSFSSASAEVTTSVGTEHVLIDIFDRVAWPAEGEILNPENEVELLPLWGENILLGDQEIDGFIAFEIPRAATIESLIWHAVDTFVVHFMASE